MCGRRSGDDAHPRASPAGAPSAVRLLLAAVLCALVATALLLVDGPAGRLLGDVVNVVALAVAVPVVAARTRRRAGRLRRVTAVFAAALAGLLAGRLLTTVGSLPLDVDLPNPLVDATFGVGALLFGVALVLLVRGEPAPATLRTAADTALLTAVAALLVLALVTTTLATGTVVDETTFVVNAAWPAVCAPLTGLTLGALASPRRWQPGPLLLGLGGLLAYTAYNTGVAVLLARGADDASGTPLETLPLLATVLVVALTGRLEDRPRAARPARVGVALVPVTTSVVLLAVVAWTWTSRTATTAEGLLALLTGVLVVVRQVAADREAVALQRDFHVQARTDGLTGLANRAALLEQAAETDPRAALVLLDVDGFKQVNDSSGHAAGDGLLVEAAVRLRRVVGHEGVVARLGGDEFAVLVADGSRAEALARRALEVLRQHFVVDGSPVALSASGGVAHGAAALDPSVLLDRADVAMYASKERSRGAVTCWSAPLGERVRADEQLRRDLRVQLLGAAEQLSVVHQPVVDLTSGLVVGAEALVRWHHPERGPVSPGVFVPLVEAEGLAHRLSERVLDLACADAARWRARGHDVRLSVNLCADELTEDLPRRVHEVLRRHDLSGHALVLELTERTLVDGGDQTVALLHTLRHQGVGVALDDFGAGYSALAYLPRLPLQVLKLDRSLVAGLHEDRAARLVVEAVLHLARRLDLLVVAEGVEVEAERQALADLGCPVAQGFGLGRPAPVEALLERLGTQAALSPPRPRQPLTPATSSSAAT